MDTHVLGGTWAYIFGGILLGIILNYVWQKINRNYITIEEHTSIMKEHIRECDARKVVIESKLTSDMEIVKQVILQLAVKADIPIEQYKDLTK